jgi:hypothetical protein
VVTLSFRRFTFVCLAVVASNQLSTYFFHAAHLVPCGHLCVLVLAFQRSMLTLFLTTLFSLLHQLGVYEHVDPFCSLFGLSASGSCGTKETIACSETEQLQCIIYWTKSNYSLLGGYRRQMLLLAHIIIGGGRTHCFVWASADEFVLLCCSFCFDTLVKLT